MTEHNHQRVAHVSARLGWSTEEDALLFEAVKNARIKGAPLKAVFMEVAAKTGRKPNSIRNYYYARVKQSDDAAYKLPHNPAFVPFDNDEIIGLLKTVLSAQANGLSVRACTLSMGEGDNRAMLRYQNKYRSLLKSNPALVKSVVADMREKGEPTINPYERVSTIRKVGRPRKHSGSLLEVVGAVVDKLDRVEGLDVSAFFESLGVLAMAATNGMAAEQQLEAMGEYQDIGALLEDLQEYKAQVSDQNNELSAQRDRFSTLLGYFRQLMDVNREFLGMTSVTKVSSLSNYIQELSRNVEDCEKWIMESK